MLTTVALSGGLRGWALSAASHRLGQPVHVDGPLALNPSLSGLTVRFDQLHVDQPTWAGGGDMVRVRHGEATLPWSALLGDGRITSLELDGFSVALIRDAQGRANWTGRRAGPLRPPRIGRLTLNAGVLDLDDRQRQTSFHGTVTTRSGSGHPPVLALVGGGRSQGDPWALSLTAGDRLTAEPLVLALHLTLDRKAGRSDLTLDGGVSHHETRLEGRLAASGPNLHDFSPLLALPLLNTPPYALQTHLIGTAKIIRLQAITGRVGASDLEGDIAITPLPNGRRLEVKAHSRSLRMSDLFAVASGGKLTSDRKPGKVLPASTLDTAPLRPLVGHIDYAADSVQAPTTPTIRSLRLHTSLDHGLATTDPLELTLARGRMIVRFAIDGRGSTPAVRLGVDVQHADTAEFQHGEAAKAPLQAIFDAHLDVAGRGMSLPNVVDGATGHFRARIFSGQIQRIQAGVISGELADSMITLLSRKGQAVSLRCGLADAAIRGGQARISTLRLSSALGDVSGVGTLDLRAETIDLTLRRIGGAPTAVHISGPLTRPHTSLAADRPVAAVKHILGDLLHLGSQPVQPAGCG